LRFWDASAVVPLLVEERGRAALLGLLERDPAMCVWWGTSIECTSALTRRERSGQLTAHGMGIAMDRLRAMVAVWNEVEATELLRNTAIRLLRVHPLRSLDALQLAAAVLVADGRPAELPFISLDDRLNDAAAREGFPVGVN
jgi:predicted nucleic acid-binding protein